MPHSGTGTPDSADRGIARAAGGRTRAGPGRPALMPGLPARPVIYFAIGLWQVTMTNCNEQSVIRQLQSAHIADSGLVQVQTYWLAQLTQRCRFCM
jgi:hypothetical protein